MTPNVRKAALFITGGLLALLALVLIVAVLTSAIKSSEVRDTQQHNTGTLDSAAETLKIIRSCTTPGQDCYERGQAQTADAVADITRVSIYAAACADKPRRQSVEQIQSCVIARLSDDTTAGRDHD